MAPRRRTAALAAAGLLSAVAPLAIGQQAAGAASQANDQDTLEFVTDGGVLVECTASVFAQHDTQDAGGPELLYQTSLDQEPACREEFSVQINASYKDQDGITRTSFQEADALLGGDFHGAYTETTVHARFLFFNCDGSQSTDCEINLTVSPK